MIEISDSSHITGADWDNGIMTIRFKGGNLYEAYDVSHDKFQEFMSAPSKGKFWRAEIEGVHTIARV